VFENRVLRRIFGPKREEGIGECRKLHIDELYDLYCSPNIIRVIKIENEMGGACSTCRGRRVVYWDLVGKTEVNRSLGKPTRRWEDNIKKGLQKVGWRQWTGLIWHRIGTGVGYL
jgi:hypothetical protein